MPLGLIIGRSKDKVPLEFLVSLSTCLFLKKIIWCVFCCCRPSPKFHMCIQTWCSPFLGCNEWLLFTVAFLSSRTSLPILWPLTSIPFLPPVWCLVWTSVSYLDPVMCLNASSCSHVIGWLSICVRSCSVCFLHTSCFVLKGWPSLRIVIFTSFLFFFSILVDCLYVSPVCCSCHLNLPQCVFLARLSLCPCM